MAGSCTTYCANCGAGDDRGIRVGQDPYDPGDRGRRRCPMIEVVDMEEIAAERTYEFAFLGFPLKLGGATGAPTSPYAVRLRG